MATNVLVSVHELAELVVERRGETRVFEEGGVFAQPELGPRTGVFSKAVVVNDHVPVAHCSVVVGDVTSNEVCGGADLCVKLLAMEVVVLGELLNARPVGFKLLELVL